MTEITHVHEGLFELRNISVPFTVSQDTKNTIRIEIGNSIDGVRFCSIEISVEIDGNIRFEGTAGITNPDNQIATLGNILTGATGAMR